MSAIPRLINGDMLAGDVATRNPVCIDRDATILVASNLMRVYEEGIRAEFGEIVGDSPALQTALHMVSSVAPTDSSVLILGETGTGKELIARGIHNLSGRRERTFVKLNCAAIPLGLLESELFGHERGAFTGAIAQKTGRFELANRGTMFLDEVGDIPLQLQAKLLRVLQEQEFERLGSSRTHKIDVRLIAATHRDLADMVKQGTFRADLYYRLKVFPIHVPTLRQRTEDIPKLVRHFTALYARRMNRRIDDIPAETMDALVRYRWPGNVRELQNFIERAVILSPHAVLRAHRRVGAVQRSQGLQYATQWSRGGRTRSHPPCARSQPLGGRRSARGCGATRDEADIVGVPDAEASHHSSVGFPHKAPATVGGAMMMLSSP